MPINDKTQQDLYRVIHIRLGGSSVEVELEQDDYDAALDEALRVYRANSQNSISFGWLFVQLEIAKQHYTLPHWVDEVQEIRRIRSGLLPGQPFEPFSMAFLQGALGQFSGGTADLVSFEAMAEYQELYGRMFGEFVPYTFNRQKKDLFIHRYPRVVEQLGLEISATKPLDELLSDTTSHRWLRSYAEAEARSILAEKYTKYASQVGAQGAITLKGSQLIEQAAKMREDLVIQIRENQDGNEPPMGFFG
jgi:hypothetical protein